MRRRRGFALMAALWLLVAITAVSLELSVMARERRLGAANTLEQTRAALAATSAVEHARARLARALIEGNSRTWNDVRSMTDPWHNFELRLADSVAMPGNAWYRARVESAGAKLHLNRSSADDLRRYLQALEIDAIRVEDVVDGIMDWRDADDHRRNRGAERPDYLRAGARELPPGADFTALDELLDVKGMTPDLFERIRPDLTLLGSGQVNVNSAPRAVLMSLPGITALAADLILAAQQGGRAINSVQQLRDLLPSGARSSFEASLPLLLPRVAFETNEVLVTGEGWLSGSPVRVRETALVARGGETAFVIWRQRQ
jgi:general secretion pathway protein K